MRSIFRKCQARDIQFLKYIDYKTFI